MCCPSRGECCCLNHALSLVFERLWCPKWSCLEKIIKKKFWIFLSSSYLYILALQLSPTPTIRLSIGAYTWFPTTFFIVNSCLSTRHSPNNVQQKEDPIKKLDEGMWHHHSSIIDNRETLINLMVHMDLIMSKINPITITSRNNHWWCWHPTPSHFNKHRAIH